MPLAYDLYREVHKGLRLALFDLIVHTGAADFRAATERAAVTDHVGRVVVLLRAHHEHEDVFVRPVIEATAPDLSALIEVGHAELDQDIVEIDLMTAAMMRFDGDDAVDAGNRLYQYLALFLARYLAHMALEQGAVMDMLRDAIGRDELLQLDLRLRASVPPPLMCDFIAVMAPSMNVDERTDMLGGMKAGAPPEIFEQFRAATQQCLPPADYTAVAGRIGLA